MISRENDTVFVAVRFHETRASPGKSVNREIMRWIGFSDDRTGTDYNFKIVVKMHEFSRR